MKPTARADQPHQPSGSRLARLAVCTRHPYANTHTNAPATSTPSRRRDTYADPNTTFRPDADATPIAYACAYGYSAYIHNRLLPTDHTYARCESADTQHHYYCPSDPNANLSTSTPIPTPTPHRNRNPGILTVTVRSTRSTRSTTYATSQVFRSTSRL
jgi:hypothetical protein